ncbi:unnamed protein product [Linum tenue]|uniref:Transcription factor TFIIIC triple barrel domain-containing protein n=1 Tax=Linum tenue TaxID=586396 RepID=A0AAV0GSX9_9ROSI|nr:unnamed protein product [Linum tenue]
MEAGLTEHSDEKGEEEYVLLDLDAVMEHVSIRPDTPYVLTVMLHSWSGHVEPNADYRWQSEAGELLLIGEYEETIGTCLVFSENEAPVLHKETGPSDANLFSGRCIVDPNQVPSKEVKPVARLQKVLKFRLLLDGVDDAQQDHPSTEGNASNQSTAAQN